MAWRQHARHGLRRAAGNVPPRYTMALPSWAGAFPLLTALTVLPGPLPAALPLPGRTLLMTGLLIGAMTYAVMPHLIRFRAAWRTSADDRGANQARRLGAARISATRITL